MTEMMEFFRETGRKGGKIGGKIAAKKMTKAQRTARAKKAAAASAKVRSKNAKATRKAKDIEPATKLNETRKMQLRGQINRRFKDLSVEEALAAHAAGHPYGLVKVSEAADERRFIEYHVKAALDAKLAPKGE